MILTLLGISSARIFGDPVFSFPTTYPTEESEEETKARRTKSTSLFEDKNFEYRYSTSDGKYYVFFKKTSPNYQTALDKYKILTTEQSVVTNYFNRFIRMPFGPSIIESTTDLSFSIDASDKSSMHIGSVGFDTYVLDKIYEFVYQVYNKLKLMHEKDIVVCNWKPEMVFLSEDLDNIMFLLPEMYLFGNSVDVQSTQTLASCEGLINKDSLFFYNEEQMNKLSPKDFDVVAVSHMLLKLFVRALNKDGEQMKIDMADKVNYAEKEKDIINSFLPFVSKKNTISTVVYNLGIIGDRQVHTAKEASDKTSTGFLKVKGFFNDVRYIADFKRAWNN